MSIWRAIYLGPELWELSLDGRDPLVWRGPVGRVVVGFARRVGDDLLSLARVRAKVLVKLERPSHTSFGRSRAAKRD